MIAIPVAPGTTTSSLPIFSAARVFGKQVFSIHLSSPKNRLRCIVSILASGMGFWYIPNLPSACRKAAPLSVSVANFGREADRFAVELTRDNHAAATAFVKLTQGVLGVPRHGWLFTVWRDTHPSLGDRLDFFNEYRPWQEGQPL